MRQTYFSNPVRRPGLTLVELLVSISLITVVSSMFLVAYRAAATEASNMRTQSTIRKISEVLVSRMQEYENYPISFRPPLPNNINFTASADTPTILRERLRVLGLRELMCLELPDHPDDIKWTASWYPILRELDLLNLNESPTSPDYGFPKTKIRRSGLKFKDGTDINPVAITSSGKARKILQRLSAPKTRPNDDPKPIDGWERFNANAELLFLAVEDSTINGSPAIELFGKTEIGDTDGDGLNEFIDAFGRPLRWLRWPTGLADVNRVHPDLLDPILYDPQTRSYRGSDDAFDRMRSDPGYSKAFTQKTLSPDVGTFPLVASAGPDGRFGMRFELPPHPPSPDPQGPRDPGIVSPESAVIPFYPQNFVYELQTFRSSSGTKQSRSVSDVLFQTDYGIVSIPDPWYPRPRLSSIPIADHSSFNDQDTRLDNDTPSSYRLGGVMKSTPIVRSPFIVTGEDDITNYSINGAYQ